MSCLYILDGGWPSWWVADHLWQLLLGFNFLSQVYVPKVDRTLPLGRFWILVDHPWDVGWPSWGWWLTIHGSCHLVLILWVKSRCWFQVCSTRLFGRFWMMGDHPWDGGWPSRGWSLTIKGSCNLVLILWVKYWCQISRLQCTSFCYILVTVLVLPYLLVMTGGKLLVRLNLTVM